MAAAQEASPYANISLENCVNIALQNEVNILAGNNAVVSAKSREKEAKSNYYPQVSAQRGGIHEESNTGARPPSKDNGTVAVSQNIYDGGLREAKVGGAHAAVGQSEYTLERTRQTVVFNVTKDFFALLRAMHLSDVQDSQVKYLEGQLGMVKTRVELGAAAEVDSLPVEAQLANARVDQISAKNAILTASIQLQNTMGLAPQPDFSVQEYSTPEINIKAVEDYLNVALAARPEIQQTTIAVSAAKYSVKSARISLRPRPAIDATYDESYISGGLHTYTVTGGFFYDIFDGGNNRAVYRDAKSGLSTAEIRAAQAEKDVQSDVRQAYYNLQNAKDRIAASDLSLVAAQKNYDVQQSRYQQGLGIPLDLLNAQVAVVTAQSNAVQARYDYYTAIAQMEFAIGRPGGLNEKEK